jgi:hypothetical protein
MDLGDDRERGAIGRDGGRWILGMVGGEGAGSAPLLLLLLWGVGEDFFG